FPTSFASSYLIKTLKDEKKQLKKPPPTPEQLWPLGTPGFPLPRKTEEELQKEKQEQLSQSKDPRFAGKKKKKRKKGPTVIEYDKVEINVLEVQFQQFIQLDYSRQVRFHWVWNTDFENSWIMKKKEVIKAKIMINQLDRIFGQFLFVSCLTMAQSFRLNQKKIIHMEKRIVQMAIGLSFVEP
ncbi:MAG: hypothetical protein EZS28_046493, partial [Streblomastix strix]